MNADGKIRGPVQEGWQVRMMLARGRLLAALCVILTPRCFQVSGAWGLRR